MVLAYHVYVIYMLDLLILFLRGFSLFGFSNLCILSAWVDSGGLSTFLFAVHEDFLFMVVFSFFSNFLSGEKA